MLPERSHYFDIGIEQKPIPGITLGLDAYYKIATDLVDDGQFGQPDERKLASMSKGSGDQIVVAAEALVERSLGKVRPIGD